MISMLTMKLCSLLRERGYQMQFGAWDINSACTITEVGPQRAVDEPLYNK